jgi:hypothetical protein
MNYAFNVRNSKSDRPSHVDYNTHIDESDTDDTGTEYFEIPRAGSFLVHYPLGARLIAIFLGDYPDAKIRDTKSLYTAVNFGIRIVAQHALRELLKRRPRGTDIGERVLSELLPNLTPPKPKRQRATKSATTAAKSATTATTAATSATTPDNG